MVDMATPSTPRPAHCTGRILDPLENFRLDGADDDGPEPARCTDPVRPLPLSAARRFPNVTFSFRVEVIDDGEAA